MTEAEAFEHLSETFDMACRNFPDVMEPYVVRMADITDRSEQKELMRAGLRETFCKRFPSQLARKSEQAA